MATCLGLYIEENIIKYAKVSKEHEQIKVESFGIKFYDNLEHAINQIVEETYSYKTPISINLSDEMYNYFSVFALLNKKDIPRAIKTEFEAFCSEKNYNPNVFETRYAITPNIQEKEKLKVIHISENKIELNKRNQKFANYKLQSIAPISMTIANVAEFNERENCLIVNIEKNTIITTILNQNIYDIKVLGIGSQDILDKINLKENSYQKAYEICKQTTIYTSEGKNLLAEETSYLEDIMPTLYEIVGQLRKVLNENTEKIEKIYITGTGALINNIDLYFEEYLDNVKCEILKPKIIKLSSDINIKDYIEVNSAISLALSGLGQGITGMNFKSTPLLDKILDVFNMEVKRPKSKKNTKKENKKIKKDLFTFDFKKPLDKIERGLLRGIAGLLILFMVYCTFANLLKQQISSKNEEAESSIINTNTQMALIEKDIQAIQSRTSEYTIKIKNLQEINKVLEENNRIKKSIPILLNSLMYIVPEDVQIISIKNTTGTHIEIQAQSKEYPQLGYLTTSIKTSGMLTNVISTSGLKENNVITIKIEGDLP